MLADVKTSVEQTYAKHIDGIPVKKIIVVKNTPQHYQAVVVLEAHGPTQTNEIITGISKYTAYVGTIVAVSSSKVGNVPLTVLGIVTALVGVAGAHIPDYFDMTWSIEGSYLIDVQAKCAWDGICYPSVKASIESREEEYDITL